MKNAEFLLPLQLALIFLAGFSKATQEIKSLAKSPETGYTGTFFKSILHSDIVDKNLIIRLTNIISLKLIVFRM